MKKLLVTLAFTVLCAACQSTIEKGATNTSPPSGELTFIVINDTYRADNLTYVRSLRRELEKSAGDIVVLHAGDILFPSLLSQRYQGAQMIDALNLLDGDANAHDPHLLIAFGNHEFDKDKLKHAPMLQARVSESQFDWLGSNIVFARDSSGRKLIQGNNLTDSRLLTVNGIKVGFVSATTDIKGAEYIERFLSAAQTIRTHTTQLRAQGAQIVVAITHQTVAQDKALLAELGNDAPDFIAGGHEHDRQHHVVNNRHLVKADADAASAAIVRVGVQTDHPTTVQYVALPGAYRRDAAIEQNIHHWQSRFDQEICRDENAAANCMQQVLGKSNVELIGEELTIRRFETNLGNVLADTARDAYAAQGAQIAFLNSGGMRLNYNIPAGDITRRHIDTLFAYPTRLALIKISGKQLQHIVEHAITDWTGNGRWLQISGFAFKHNAANGSISGLSVMTPHGLRPVCADETLLAVTNDYLLDKHGDQDGYRMLSDALIVDPAQPRIDLKQELLKMLARTQPNGIAPKTDGRICNLQRTPACALFQ